jgi:hypothetical protein
MRRISSAQWWRQVDETFRNQLRFFIEKARSAEKSELREAGAEHECGHRWEITIRSSMHSSIVGGGAKSHKDAPIWDGHTPVTVRAHSLRDALLVAATLPITAWFPEEVGEP